MTPQIAVFENVSALRFLYVSMLMHQGYKLSFHDESRSGLDTVSRLAPHLIIYGNISGVSPAEWRFVYRLQEQPSLRATPILVVTTALDILLGSGDLPIRPNIAYLGKPFTRADLIAAVEPLLARAPHDTLSGPMTVVSGPG